MKGLVTPLGSPSVEMVQLATCDVSDVLKVSEPTMETLSNRYRNRHAYGCRVPYCSLFALLSDVVQHCHNFQETIACIRMDAESDETYLARQIYCWLGAVVKNDWRSLSAVDCAAEFFLPGSEECLTKRTLLIMAAVMGLQHAVPSRHQTSAGSQAASSPNVLETFIDNFIHENPWAWVALRYLKVTLTSDNCTELTLLESQELKNFRDIMQQSLTGVTSEHLTFTQSLREEASECCSNIVELVSTLLV